MSNFRSVAVVTATLEHVLQDAVNQAVSQGDVRIGAPTAKLAEENKPLVNLCLYRIVPNAAHSNAYVATRDGAGESRARTRLALDLHYLLSFYGNPAKFEPERLYGACALALGAAPGLSVAAIETASTDSANSPALDHADLAAEGRTIRIGREQPSLDDWSKLWSVFFQVPYTLSTACIVENVVIETQDAPGGAAPVASPTFHAAPMGPFVIESAGPAPRQMGAVAWGGTLYLSGSGIARIGNGLWLDDAAQPIADDWVAGGNLALPMKPALFGGITPRIGAHRLQVVAAPADPATPAHLRRRSNMVALVIAPSVTAIAPGPGAGQVSVTVAPPLQEGQVATLLLNARSTTSPASAAIAAIPPAAFPASSLVFDCSQLGAGSYLARLDVDGYASAPEVGSDPNQPDFGQLTGPLVTLT
ncbi:Pvc16 family protein [Sphingomonas sp. KR3-1]|uniref:Pvc16 family protein n=1 Tax=Sphingomonas sp. KR3-1 TaxID=3156611 RepID=UPI0032B45C02